MIALRLARAGYCGGDPEKVMQMQVGWVNAIAQYEGFVGVYELTYIELNKKKES